MKEWKNTSVSQHDTFTDCNRKWWINKILGIKTEPNESALRGQEIHDLCEKFGNTGEIPDHKYYNYAAALLGAAAGIHPFKPGDPNLLIEKKLGVPSGIVPWIGYLDLAYSADDGGMFLTDYKTTKDFKWAKNRKEARDCAQSITYGKYIYDLGHEGDIAVNYIYVRILPKRVPKEPQIKIVPATLTKDLVESRWEEMHEITKKMHALSVVEDMDDVPYNAGACSKYGGCPFRGDHCNVTPTVGDYMKKEGNNKVSNDFLANLQGKTPPPAETKEATEAPKVAVNPFDFGPKTTGEAEPESKGYSVKPESNGVPEGVKPPDAPPSTTSDEDYKELTMTAAQKKAAAKAEKAEKSEKAEPKKRKTKKAAEGLVIYIGCAPLRYDIEPTLFEDWVAPILESMNDFCMETENKPNWYLLGFGPQKALLAAKVSEWIQKGLPPVILVQNPSPLWSDVSAVLVPHAAQVIRSYR